MIDSTQSDTIKFLSYYCFLKELFNVSIFIWIFFLCEGYMNSNINLRATPFC